MKILVTGATGYFGHMLALTLARKGNIVHALVRNPQSPLIPQHENIIAFKGDITDKNSIRPAIKDCKEVYHSAALVKLYSKDPSAFFKVNVEGTKNILSVALEEGVKKLVFTSSGSVMGPSLKEPLTEKDPRTTAFDNDYELTKYIGENIIKEYNIRGLCAVTVYLTKIFGPGIETHPMSINTIIKKFIRNKISFCPSPDHYISNYVFIEDAINGHILAMEKGVSNERYIIGGANKSFRDFFQVLREQSGIKGKLFPVPRLLVSGLALLNLVQAKLSGNDPYLTMKGINHIYCNKALSSEKAIRQLGYKITPFDEAIKKTILFLKQKNNVS